MNSVYNPRASSWFLVAVAGFTCCCEDSPVASPVVTDNQLFFSSNPPADSIDAYFRGEIEVKLTPAAWLERHLIDVILQDERGLLPGELQTDTYLLPQTLILRPFQSLLPETGYHVAVEHAYLDQPQRFSFMTSELGLPVVDSVAGQAYTGVVDQGRVLPYHASAVFAHSTAVSRLSVGFSDYDVDGSGITVRLHRLWHGEYNLVDSELVIDTSGFPVVTVNAPFVQSLVEVDGGTIDMYDLTLEFVIDPTGSWGTMTIAAQWDLSGIRVAWNFDLLTMCEILSEAGYPCDVCPNGEEECAWVRIDQIPLEVIPESMIPDCREADYCSDL